MVAQEVEDAVVRDIPAAPEGDRSIRPRVVRSGRARLPFVDAADVDRRHAVDGADCAAAVRVVDKARARAPARDSRQPVFGVEAHGVGNAGDDAAGLVAVGVACAVVCERPIHSRLRIDRIGLHLHIMSTHHHMQVQT